MRVFTCQIQQRLQLEQLQELAYLAGRFESSASLSVNERTVDIKSILGLCTILFRPGEPIEICVSGYDEEEAMCEIKRWFY